MEKIKVAELFAGVGGFRVGLEKYDKNLFDFVFANQWEPGKKVQHAYDCYVSHFGDKNTSNEDIAIAKYTMPNDIDLLVGGFPCQDYSVAATNAKGIQGKKGVLWWEISWILEHKKPKMILLENVDRLLKSPSKQRGRDFAIMLLNMHKNGYDVEWQVINAADYGMVQRRRRVFIFARRRDCFKLNGFENFDIIKDFKKGFFSRSFPCELIEGKNEKIDLKKTFKDELDITNNFNKGKFFRKGYMINGIVQHSEYNAINKTGLELNLDSIIEKKGSVDKKYFLNEIQIEKMHELRDGKKVERTKPDGTKYIYSEGRMNFADPVFLPGRTMLTSEGTINRSSHIIECGRFKYRFITPLEAERLNGFPDNWTAFISNDRMRYFCMGNALVVDLITTLGKEIKKMFSLFKKEHSTSSIKNKLQRAA